MLEIGQNLSHCSIAVKIGNSEMGEVFREKDQKLGKGVSGFLHFPFYFVLQAGIHVLNQPFIDKAAQRHGL